MTPTTSLLRSILVTAAFSLSQGDRITHPRLCGGGVRHVHLAVGTDPASEMTVSFATIPSLYSAPVAGVLVGTSPGKLNDLFLETEPASSYNLEAEIHFRNNANHGNFYYSPHYHHIRITGLVPSTKYYYRPVAHANIQEFKRYNLRRPGALKTQQELEDLEQFEEKLENENRNNGNGNEELLDEQSRRKLQKTDPYDGSMNDCPSPAKIRSFKTAPHQGSKSAVSFAVIGDLGQFPHSEETVASMMQNRDKIDAIILGGDIGYTGYNHARWDTFFDFLDDYPVAEYVPVQICPGNHDIDKAKDSQRIFLAYENRFRMPQVRPAQLGLYDGPDFKDGHLNLDAPPYPLPYEWGNAYYAFTYGPARFVMISAYSSMEPNSTQYNWLIDELNSIDRITTPWAIAVIHTPIYNTFHLHLKDLQIIAAKKHLEPLFVKHKINVVFSGHIHAYLRTSNVAMDKLDPRGPIHITVGAGGRKCEAPFVSEEPEPWVEVRDATIFGYGMFQILNESTASWNWVHTGHNDERDYNQLWGSNETLPAGPGRDQVFIQNQFFL